MKRKYSSSHLPDDPLWYQDAIIYEAHVRAFADDDGDGYGDFQGLTKKLDYLQELGVTALWLLPFYPSPLKDDGYDIADYYDVHPRYGTLRDFETFLREAHRRGMRVITELVVNHTSDQHPWFQRARRAKPGSRYRDFYVWSDTPDRYREARIIFQDYEHSNWTYDPVAKAYFWHRFYSHQPDLNYDNPAVHKAVMKAMDFWFDMGVDGMRLDAVPYLYEREGTDCENLPETHGFLKELRRHVDRKYANRMLLAEANQWPEDAAAYFGDGDECHMNFHFPLMPRLFMAIHMEDRFPILDILQQTPQIHETSQWAVFLRNHDELTLEMVTDEERDYMYHVYALDKQARVNLGIRRRLAPLLGNNRRRIELMNALLFSLPGTPVLYYGDELGMGDNIYLGDRNGVRTPMQWSADRNAGFSRANPQSLYLPVIIDPEYNYETVNVEAQEGNPNSFLWWMKRLVALRNRFRAFGRGTIEFLQPENRKVLAFVRQFGSERILIVANLSRFVQYARLDLSPYTAAAPVELFGRTRFPTIGQEPYFLTLGPHSFYWFALETSDAVLAERERTIPSLEVEGSWRAVLRDRARDELERLLPAYLRDRRWFGAKARDVTGVTVADTIPVPYDDRHGVLVVIDVGYAEGKPETYLLPLAFTQGIQAEELVRDRSHAVIASLRVRRKGGEVEEGVLFDAVYEGRFTAALLGLIERRKGARGEQGTLQGLRTRSYRQIRNGGTDLVGRAGEAEQSNTSILFGDRMILKLYRRLEEGTNPDREMSTFLSEHARFSHTPSVGGHLEYRKGRRSSVDVGLLQAFVPNEGDAWQYTLDEVDHFLERGAARVRSLDDVPVPGETLFERSEGTVPEEVRTDIGPYLESARLLGQRTAEMHMALASDRDTPEFAPERFTPFYRRGFYQSLRNLTSEVMTLLRKRVGSLPEGTQPDARRVLGLETEILGWFQSTLEKKRRMVSLRERIHGDYHLGQVLFTGKDFVIIDFEGEPARSLGQRRIKRSPLQDVAGMLRSFHYAADVGLHARAERRVPSEEEARLLADLAELWHRWVEAAFLGAYRAAAAGAPFLEGVPREEIESLLNLHRLEKALYELGYELNNRPSWVRVPVEGILHIVGEIR